MTEFTKQHIRNLRDMVEKSLDSNEVYVSEIALNEIQRLQARVQELEVEGKQVCESTIFEQDYQTMEAEIGNQHIAVGLVVEYSKKYHLIHAMIAVSVSSMWKARRMTYTRKLRGCMESCSL